MTKLDQPSLGQENFLDQVDNISNLIQHVFSTDSGKFPFAFERLKNHIATWICKNGGSMSSERNEQMRVALPEISRLDPIKDETIKKEKILTMLSDCFDGVGNYDDAKKAAISEMVERLYKHYFIKDHKSADDVQWVTNTITIFN